MRSTIEVRKLLFRNICLETVDGKEITKQPFDDVRFLVFGAFAALEALDLSFVDQIL